MKKLYQVTCCGKLVSITKRSDIYVVAENSEEASEKALNKVRELKYDRIDDFVSNVELIADEKDLCDSLLVV